MNEMIITLAWMGGFSFLIIFFVLIIARKMMDVYYSIYAIIVAAVAGTLGNAITIFLLPYIIPSSSSSLSPVAMWSRILPSAIAITLIIWKYPGSEISLFQSSRVGIIAAVATPFLALLLFGAIMALASGMPFGLIIMYIGIPILIFYFIKSE